MTTVLIIEDERPLREGLAAKFEREGFQASVAADGSAGLAQALTLHPDVIILDMMMPKMDGITFLDRLNEDDWGKQAKVFIWTNSNNSEKTVKAKRYGVRGILVKSEMTFKDVVGRVRAA